jgi:phosphate-selective porin OprO/OprP
MRLKWHKAVGALVFGTAAVLLMVGPAVADDQQMLLELKARLDKLEKDNSALKQRLSGQPAPYQAAEPEKEKINKAVDAYLKAKDDKKKEEEKAKEAQKEIEGVAVGSDTSIKARWNLDQGLLFETPNKDFVAHLGFFFQWDTVSWTQTPSSRSPGQIGNLEDGTFFRRMRPLWDGRAWDMVEWNVILALEQVQGAPVTGGAGTLATNGNSLINLDEVWVGLYGIPLIGRIRFGHMKVPQGLEGDMFSSSRAMTFNERAAYTDAFYNNFATGICILNSALNDGNGDRVTWQGMVYRDDNPRTNTGADFDDGAYAATGRFTGLVFDNCQEHHLLHLGVSGTYRKAEKNDVPGAGQSPGTSGPDFVRFRARPELRDAIGGFGDGTGTPGDAGRLVDTGNVISRSASVVGSELFYIMGPFSVMAEYAFATMDHAVVPIVVNKKNVNVSGDRTFGGGYVTVSYFLTGETRTYDRTLGREGTFYVERPFTNAFAKRDENGGGTFGWGAWELAARYSYLNLNDGPIRGGVMDGVTLGVNWYLNSNVKMQVEYLTNSRWDKGGAPFATGGGGNIPATVQALGTRVQFQF